jgi:hypothetical protein
MPTKRQQPKAPPTKHQPRGEAQAAGKGHAASRARSQRGGVQKDGGFVLDCSSIARDIFVIGPSGEVLVRPIPGDDEGES